MIKNYVRDWNLWQPEEKNLVYLNLEGVREVMHVYIYLWVLICCNFKIEQRKHSSAIGSAVLLALCFHWPSPAVESLSNLPNLVWKEPLELVYSYLPLQAGLSREGDPDPSLAEVWVSLWKGFLQPLPLSDHLHGGIFFFLYLHEVSWLATRDCCISSFPCEPLT